MIFYVLGAHVHLTVNQPTYTVTYLLGTLRTLFCYGFTEYILVIGIQTDRSEDMRCIYNCIFISALYKQDLKNKSHMNFIVS